jgi:glycosyltransferase involved in cell wall biosynthesis
MFRTSARPQQNKAGLRVPRVSVCIPVYNGARYLQQAIESVLNQTFDDFELVVVDDSSNDDSPSIVSSINDSRVRFHRNATRLGLANNWNQCLRFSRGEYVNIFHQDDVMLQENLEQKIAVLDHNPSVGFVFSRAQVIDANGNLKSDGCVDHEPAPGISNGREFFKSYFQRSNVICCPTVIARRRCYERLGQFDASLHFTCDFEMWMRLALFNDVAYLLAPSVTYREHDESESRKFDNHLENLRENFRSRVRLLDKYPSIIPDSRAVRRAIELDYSKKALMLANHHYSHGRHDAAKGLLKFAAAAYQPILKNKRFIRLSTKLLIGERASGFVTRAKHFVRTA